jgi:hypothetical protein
MSFVLMYHQIFLGEEHVIADIASDVKPTEYESRLGHWVFISNDDFVIFLDYIEFLVYLSYPEVECIDFDLQFQEFLDTFFLVFDELFASFFEKINPFRYDLDVFYSSF